MLSAQAPPQHLLGFSTAVKVWFWFSSLILILASVWQSSSATWWHPG